MRNWDGFAWAIFGFKCFAVAYVCLAIFVIIGAVVKHREKYTLTCYNSIFEITYMSPADKYVGRTSNNYGVWYFKDGLGAYIQNSGETCVSEEVAHVSDGK